MATVNGGSGNEIFYHGSTFLSGNDAKLDLTGVNAKYFICAITVTSNGTAAQFAALQTLNGGVNVGMGDTHFASTDTATAQTLDDDWGAETQDSDNDAQIITSSSVFVPGVTIYGMWDYVELDAGDVICYVAPIPKGLK